MYISATVYNRDQLVIASPFSRRKILRIVVSLSVILNVLGLQTSLHSLGVSASEV